jgi:hypothetical protein
VEVVSLLLDLDQVLIGIVRKRGEPAVCSFTVAGLDSRHDHRLELRRVAQTLVGIERVDLRPAGLDRWVVVKDEEDFLARWLPRHDFEDNRRTAQEPA